MPLPYDHWPLIISLSSKPSFLPSFIHWKTKTKTSFSFPLPHIHYTYPFASPFWKLLSFLSFTSPYLHFSYHGSIFQQSSNLSPTHTFLEDLTVNPFGVNKEEEEAKAMSSKWRKVKLALGFNSCAHIPRPLDDSSSPLNSTAARFSGAAPLSVVFPAGDTSSYRPSTPTPSSSGLRLSKSGSKSPKVRPYLKYPLSFFTCWTNKVSIFIMFFCFLKLPFCFNFTIEWISMVDSGEKGFSLFGFRQIHCIFLFILNLFFIEVQWKKDLR